MDLGGMPARLDPASLDLDRSLRDRLSRFAIERRSTDGWSRVALFGTVGEAAQNIDLLIAMHGGDIADYRIERVGLKRRVAVAGWITLGTMVVATVAAWIALAAG